MASLVRGSIMVQLDADEYVQCAGEAGRRQKVVIKVDSIVQPTAPTWRAVLVSTLRRLTMSFEGTRLRSASMRFRRGEWGIGVTTGMARVLIKLRNAKLQA